MNWVVFMLFVLFLVSFVCSFAYVPYKEEGISGDWRKWGFEFDPLEPEPNPVSDLVL